MARKQVNEMSFLDHLEDLRWHLIRATLGVVIAATLGLMPNLGPGLEVATNMDHDAFSSMLKRGGLGYIIQQYPQVMPRLLKHSEEFPLHIA